MGTNQIAELQRTRDEELGGKLQELELALKEREKETMKAESALKANNDSKKQITRSINTDKKALEEKQKETAGMQEMYDRLREEDRKCTEALKAANKRYEAISMGKFDDGSGEADTLQQQLMKLK